MKEREPESANGLWNTRQTIPSEVIKDKKTTDFDLKYPLGNTKKKYEMVGMEYIIVVIGDSLPGYVV